MLGTSSVEISMEDSQQPMLYLIDPLHFFRPALIFHVWKKSARKNMFETVVDLFIKCSTKDDMIHLFLEHHSEYDAVSYAEFALNKLRASNQLIPANCRLTSIEEQKLKEVASWQDYCNALSLDQLKVVGW